MSRSGSASWAAAPNSSNPAPAWTHRLTVFSSAAAATISSHVPLRPTSDAGAAELVDDLEVAAAQHGDHVRAAIGHVEIRLRRIVRETDRERRLDAARPLRRPRRRTAAGLCLLISGAHRAEIVAAERHLLREIG